MTNTETTNFPKERSFVWLITQFKEVLIKDHDKNKENLEIEDLTISDINKDKLLKSVEDIWSIHCSIDDLCLISSIHTNEFHTKTYVLKTTLNNEQRKSIQEKYPSHFYPYRSLIDEVSYKNFSNTLKESFILLLDNVDRDKN
jgi:hypothetical protein